MKELSIQEKAKRYDRTIERAKIALDCCSSTSITTKNTIYDILPELRESEDEKIRKDIVAAVETYGDFTQGRKEEIYTWLEKQGEQTHADKVKPKFKVGDWVMLDRPVLITKVEDMPYNTYQYWTSDGTWFGDATKSKLWTIQDAKKGDVLVNQNGEMPFIFRECKDNHIYCYCGYTNRKDIFFDRFVNIEGEELHWVNLYYEQVYPATKEQRDLLFQKMKDDGYEWDAEKLELKEIEQNPINKIEPKFHEGEWVVQENIGVYKVIEVCESWYEVIDNKDKHYSIGFDKEYMCHLWTIKDAKDGDVLATPNYIYIFNSIDKETEIVSFYCLMKKSDEHFSFGDYRIHDEIWNSTPATKEQCDLLFKKMKEEGYIWDVDKKLVDKIEPKLKVESKFHIDNWIVFNGLVLYIEEVVNGFYRTVSIDGIHRSYDWNIDNAARLWTIQEAKYGDVLTDGKFIGIFKDNNYNPTDKYGCMCFYCSFDIYNDEFYTESGGYNPTYFYPATKEQYNILMKAIADAGYTFDFENKKLNKIDTYCQENCKGFQETGKCFCDGECKAKKEYMGQKHKELNEDDENMIRYIGNAITCKESAKYLEEKGIDMIKAHRWLESFKDKVLPKQEWSKEDDGFVDLLLAIFNNSHPNGIFTIGDIAVFNGNCVRSDKIINWIKSLKYKVQPKQELSEDDKDYYDAIIAKLEVTKDDALLTDNQMEFLKSLKNKI